MHYRSEYQGHNPDGENEVIANDRRTSAQHGEDRCSDEYQQGNRDLKRQHG